MSVIPFPSERRASSNEVVELIPALRRFARTFCRNHDDADDLVQATLTKAIANLDKFEPGTRLRSWLFTIMRNTFCSSYRKAIRESPGLLECVAGSVATPASQEWSQRSREVAKAIDSLSKPHQQIIFLVCVAETSYQDAAEICGCDIGTIKSRLNRARRALLQALGETSADALTKSESVATKPRQVRMGRPSPEIVP
jgi:RNA polymerase sigma-70 factor (ECF subfamily)